MNAEDKLEYHDNLIKNMTRKCHSKCFKKENSKLDNLCLSACYHKYVNVISTLRNLSIKHGDKEDSEYIYTVFNPRYDPVVDILWSKGGSKYMHVPPISINLRHEVGKIYPVKGYNPYRDEFENQ
jgi:hypothetical protein